MKPLLLLIFTCSTLTVSAQRPKDGTYTNRIAWAEWAGKSAGSTCTVVIKGYSIKVLHNGKINVSGKKGDIYAEGMIIKHTKTGKWIIGKTRADRNAPEIGGCSDGPPVIDFKRKKFWSC